MSRNSVRIEDISSCDWICSGDGLRIKRSSVILDHSSDPIPDPHTTPAGTIPTDMAQNSTLIEVYSDGVIFWSNTSCDPDDYAWVSLGTFLGSGTGNKTTFQLRSGNSTSTPASPDTPPSSPINGDALVQKFDDRTNFWLRTGGSWVLTWSESNSEDYNHYQRNNVAYDPPASPSDPPNPSGSNPSTNIQQYDTYVSNYSTHLVYYSANSSGVWVEDFREIKATIASMSISTGLTDTSGTITGNLSTGISGGQSMYGGTASGNNLTIFSTSHATKGKIIFGTSAYDEVNNRLGIGTTSPANKLTVIGGDALINTLVVGLGTGSISNNTAIGVTSLNANTTGSLNTGLGAYTLLTNTTGTNNTAVGTSSLQLNLGGSHNTAVGSLSLSGNSSGTQNVGVGYNVLTANTTGSFNVAIGYTAGNGTSGVYSNNVFIGYKAADNITTGANANIVIGNDIDLQSAGGSNQLTIGNLIFGTGLTSTGTTVSTGNIGIGVAAPSARLHLPAGTATAGTAPLKLTTGTALTTPADGALEYHTSHLYFTIGSTRYQLDQQFTTANNGVSYSAGVLTLGTTAAGTGAADFTANRFQYLGAFDYSLGSTYATHTSFPVLYLVGATGRVGIGTTAPSAAFSVTNIAGLGAAPSVATLNAQGAVLSTGVIATLGAQQISNPLRWKASGWGTTGSAAQYVDYVAYVLPIQGTTAPTADWILQSSINAGSYGNSLYYSSGGSLSLGTNATATAKLQVRGTIATTTALFETSASVQLLKLTDTLNELGATTIPLTKYSTKTVNNYAFTATANSEIGYSITGTSTARATASDNITGVSLTPTLISAAATQTLNALKLNATFTDSNSATKYLIDAQTASTSLFSITSEGKTIHTATYTTIASNDSGVLLAGTVTARNTASDRANGLYVTTAVTAAAAASQTLNGVKFTQTLTSNVATHILNGLTVDTTFTVTNAPEQNIINLKNATTTMLALTADGRLYGSALHNNANATTGSSKNYIASGTYTPTLVNATNVAASTPSVCTWMRVGNVVTVSGNLDIDVTAAGLSELTISLPIASTSTVGGGVIADTYFGSVGSIGISTTAGCQFDAVNTANHRHNFTFTYEVV